jgi:signal transduction histidine kinase
LWVALLIRTIISRNSFDIWANAGILVITVIVGTLLIRSIVEEVRFREKIEALAVDLEKANERQATLIHFMSHEIKGFLTKSRNIFSMILEGDYGSTTTELGNTAQLALDSDTKGISMVQEILSAANLKKGTIQYSMENTDIKKILLEIIEDQKKSAEEKKLSISTLISETDDFHIIADGEQVRHAFKNIVDNAIKYTLTGTIEIRLFKNNESVICSVKDTGVGVSAEDIPRLFTEGGAGRHALKINVDSSGYGLYIAKKIVEAHHGKIWHEANSDGKGSTFSIALPILQNVEGKILE